MTMPDIKEILKGIDKDECEDSDGWWETSTGAEFGARKLKEVQSKVDELLERQREACAYAYLKEANVSQRKYDAILNAKIGDSDE